MLVSENDALHAQPLSLRVEQDKTELKHEDMRAEVRCLEMARQSETKTPEASDDLEKGRAMYGEAI